MSKMNNKLILAFGIITFILGLSLAFPAGAYYTYNNNGATYFPDPSTYQYVSAPQYTYPTYQYNYPVGYTYPTVQYAPTVYTASIYNVTPEVIEGCEGRNTGFSTVTGQSCVGNYVPAPTATTTTVTKTTAKTTDTTATASKDSYSGLAANALFGSNSFMPSGLIQWIFFIVLVVTIIFLWRYVYAEEKYKAEPMKHA